jgi:glycine cleavage system aminomethyltransferase T
VKHELTKHIGVDAFFTRSHCHQKTIALQYVPSELQVADLFTKAQTREHHLPQKVTESNFPDSVRRIGLSALYLTNL